MFSVKIVSPTDTLFAGDVDFLVAPGIQGALGILSRHAPLLASLTAGEIRLTQKKKQTSIAISGGLMEVLENKVTVLAKETV